MTDVNLIPENEIGNKKPWKYMNKNGNPGALYGLGFVGALVYFLQHATTFPEGVVGFFKAIIWPALIAYKLLEFFKF